MAEFGQLLATHIPLFQKRTVGNRAAPHLLAGRKTGIAAGLAFPWKIGIQNHVRTADTNDKGIEPKCKEATTGMKKVGIIT